MPTPYLHKARGVCPVCHKETRLVRHHDHFQDFCLKLAPLRSLSEIREDRNSRDFWATFLEVYICHECNGICPDIKEKNSFLPKCVSFSPEEMILLLRDKKQLSNIWKRKKELYRPRFQRLLALGIAKKIITEAWQDRSIPPNTTRITRERMLVLLEQMPQEFQQLCTISGNDIQLATHLKKAQWENWACNSFCFWYHAKHGDPGCRNNQFGIGCSLFRNWFCALCLGENVRAQSELSRGLYYKQQAARHS